MRVYSLEVFGCSGRVARLLAEFAVWVVSSFDRRFLCATECASSIMFSNRRKPIRLTSLDILGILLVLALASLGLRIGVVLQAYTYTSIR